MDLQILLFWGVFSFKVSFSKAGLSTCNNEYCPEGYFCYEKVCRKCLKCDFLFRKGNFCVIDFNDCEECLEGYEEVLVTDFSNIIKPCKPVKKKVKLKTCENDNNCPKNNYCNEESCVQCFNCSLLNRVPPIEKCAKGLNDCGSCIEGFTEMSVTTEVNYKPCEKNTWILPDKSSTNSISPFLVTIFPVILMISFIIFALVKQRVLDSKTTYQRPVYPSAPPFYSIESTECQSVQNICKTEEIQSTNVAVVHEMKQQAKVFKQPDAPYYYYRDEKADQLNALFSVDENDGSHLSSLPSSNSSRPQELNCLSRISQPMNNVELDSTAEQSNGNTVDNNEFPSRSPDVLDVIDAPQISDESVEESNCLLGTQNVQQSHT